MFSVDTVYFSLMSVTLNKFHRFLVIAPRTNMQTPIRGTRTECDWLFSVQVVENIYLCVCVCAHACMLCTFACMHAALTKAAFVAYVWLYKRGVTGSHRNYISQGSTGLKSGWVGGGGSGRGPSELVMGWIKHVCV